MALDIVRASQQDDTTLRNLYQFYLYEFSRFMRDWHTNYAGRFIEDDLDGIWSRANRHILLAKVDGDLAGFAIVDNGIESHFTDAKHVVYMAEFFVLAPFQRSGIGAEFAMILFDRFPGNWEVFEMRENLNAQYFWRKVIGEYTGGHFEEVEAKQTNAGVIQIFDNSDHAAG